MLAALEAAASGGELRGARVDIEQRFDEEEVIASLVGNTTDLAGALPQLVTTLTDETMHQLGESATGAAETTEVPVGRLAQFLVEVRFIGEVQAATEKIPPLEGRALGVAQDVIRLVSFQPDDLEAVVESGIERLRGEIEALTEARDAIDATIDAQLAVVIDGTNPYDLTRITGDLDQHIRRHHGERAAAGVWSLFQKLSDRAGDAFVKLVYRKNDGVLMARQARAMASTEGKLVDRVLNIVHRSMPRQSVLAALPSYYRQLFYGQATINETFWVGRDKQLESAKRAINAFDGGASGAIVITGDRGSGKTSLVQRVASELLSRRAIHRVLPPRGGSIEPSDFVAALSAATRAEGTPDEDLGAAARRLGDRDRRSRALVGTHRRRATRARDADGWHCAPMVIACCSCSRSAGTLTASSTSSRRSATMPWPFWSAHRWAPRSSAR